MRKESAYRSVFRKTLLQSTATLLLFLFTGNTLKAQLTWLESGSQAYELCNYLTGEEAPVDDAESQKKEKKDSAEEFVFFSKPFFAALIGTIYSLSFVYQRNFKSRVSDMIFPPPKVA